jgi:predicted amidohydrolase
MTTPSRVKVAAIQLTSSDDAAANIANARRLLEQAAQAGAKIALLPENVALMGRRESDKFAIAEDEGSGPLQQALSDAARECGLWVVGGTLPIKLAGESRVAAAVLVFDESGKQVARYDKMHLFDVSVAERGETYRESASIAPGAAPVVVDTPAGPLGLSVCYDLRFPELFRSSAMVCRAGGLHRSHRTRALGDATTRPCDRESGFRGGGRPDGAAPQWS